MSFKSGKASNEYPSAAQSRLHPAVAFDAAGRDLLTRAAHWSGRTADHALRSLVRDDLEALIFVRLPQLPSCRPHGA
jgi:hypothetical protein